jgi:MOSC domain-containing protein YiiM
MPALLTGHGRPGFYLRVLEQGDVGAGDAIDKVAGGRHGLTVERVSAMLYTPDHHADARARATTSRSTCSDQAASRIASSTPGNRASRSSCRSVLTRVVPSAR